MPWRQWKSVINDTPYTIRVDQQFASSRFTVKINDEIIYRHKALIDIGPVYDFMIEGIPLTVCIYPNLLVITKIELVLNDHSQVTGKRVYVQRDIPLWVWGFVLIMIAIGTYVFSFNKLTPSLLIIFGGYCIFVSKNIYFSPVQRAIICLLVTGLFSLLLYLLQN